MDQRHSDCQIDPFENFTSYLYKRVDAMLQSLPTELENFARERRRSLNSEMIAFALDHHLAKTRSNAARDEPVATATNDDLNASETIDNSESESPVERAPDGLQAGDNREANGPEVASLLAAYYRGDGGAGDALVKILEEDLRKYFSRRLPSGIDPDNVNNVEGLRLLVSAKLLHSQIDLDSAESAKHRNARVFDWVYQTADRCLVDFFRKQEPYKVYHTTDLTAQGELSWRTWTLAFTSPASMREATVEFSIAEVSLSNLRQSIEAIQECTLYCPPSGSVGPSDHGLGAETPVVKFFVNGIEMLAVPARSKDRAHAHSSHRRVANPLKTAFEIKSTPDRKALVFLTHHKGDLELRDSIGRSFLRFVAQKPERLSTTQSRGQTEEAPLEQVLPDPKDPSKANTNRILLRMWYDELFIGLDELQVEHRTGLLLMTSLELAGELVSDMLRTGLPENVTWPSHNIVRGWVRDGLSQLVSRLAARELFTTRRLSKEEVLEPEQRRKVTTNALRELGEIVWSHRAEWSKESGNNG